MLAHLRYHSLVRATLRSPLRVAVLATDADTATLVGARLENSVRAAVGNFGAHVILESTALDCAALFLAGEIHQSHPFSFDDRGGNECGCEATETVDECQVLSSNLAPPTPLQP